MRILFLAPEPFYQERGTPIAVRLALEVLARRGGDRIDLLTYHEGTDVEIANVAVSRIRPPKFVRNVGPGISLRKLICDIFFLSAALKMVRRARSDQYQVIHAVEESVFIAWLIRRLYGIPYIYDMDSSLTLQVTEKWSVVKPLAPLLSLAEKIVMRNSVAVVPVCNALAIIAQQQGAEFTTVLSDISLLDPAGEGCGAVSLRDEAGVGAEAVLLLYIGNLERYQGMDLLLESFAQVAGACPDACLVVIGGQSEHIKFYQAKAAASGVGERVCFLGPRPVSALNDYLLQADVLLSPRIKGNNTPMKIYSYLHSGVAILATALPTHTQVLSDEVAKLALPEKEAFAEAMRDLIQSPMERRRIGEAARKLAEEKYTFDRFRETLNGIYDAVASKLTGGKSSDGLG